MSVEPTTNTWPSASAHNDIHAAKKQKKPVRLFKWGGRQSTAPWLASDARQLDCPFPAADQFLCSGGSSIGLFFFFFSSADTKELRRRRTVVCYRFNYTGGARIGFLPMLMNRLQRSAPVRKKDGNNFRRKFRVASARPASSTVGRWKLSIVPHLGAQTTPFTPLDGWTIRRPNFPIRTPRVTWPAPSQITHFTLFNRLRPSTAGYRSRRKNFHWPTPWPHRHPTTHKVIKRYRSAPFDLLDKLHQFTPPPQKKKNNSIAPRHPQTIRPHGTPGTITWGPVKFDYLFLNKN